MTRTLKILLLIAGDILGSSVGAAYAQQVSFDRTDHLLRCEIWNLVEDGTGMQRRLFPLRIKRQSGILGFLSPEGAVALPGEYFEEDRVMRGVFMIPNDFPLALWSEPNSRRPTSLFTTQTGSTIDFIPDGARSRLTAIGGQFDSLALTSIPRSIICPREATRRRADDLEPKSLGSLFGDKNKNSPSRSDPSTSIKRVTEEGADTGPSGAETRLSSPGSLGPPQAGALPPLQGPAHTATDPLPKKEAQVCTAELKRLNLPSGTKLADPQAVGLRNRRTHVDGFDYLSISGDALPLDFSFDVSDSVDQLVPYEPIAPVMNAGKVFDSLWVSVPEMDSRAKPRRDAPGSIVTLRIIVAGGPQEIAISGLEQVGAELKKQSTGRVRLEIWWHAIGGSGSMAPAVRFESLEELVRAAREASGEGRPAVLNEEQLRTFLENFEQVLIARTASVDKVFWIKGAYTIPATIPARFEKFISAVSESSAVIRTPSGQVGKWLIVVTARMPGFSVAYLKEPVYSRQVGDVIDEPDSIGRTGPRRLIGDPSLLATRLWASALRPRAGAVPDSASSGLSAAGILVHNDKDLFVQRGQVLSREAATVLRARLQRVLELWSTPNGGAIRLEILNELASKTGKSSPTLTDLLQSPDDRIGIKLPKLLPDWSRKALTNLNATDSREASAFVVKYLAGANRLVDGIFKNLDTKRDQDCILIYVPDEYFGISP